MLTRYHLAIRGTGSRSCRQRISVEHIEKSCLLSKMTKRGLESESVKSEGVGLVERQ